MSGTGPEPTDESRLDVWLWCARVRRSRADCAALVASGAVRINRRPVDRPGARVRAGDVLTVALGPPEALCDRSDADRRLPGTVRVLRIREVASRRGGAAEAARLFEEIL